MLTEQYNAQSQYKYDACTDGDGEIRIDILNTYLGKDCRQCSKKCR